MFFRVVHGYAPDDLSLVQIWFDSAMKFMNYEINLFGTKFTLWQMLVLLTLSYLLTRFLFRLLR